jgi:hypothetical protein
MRGARVFVAVALVVLGASFIASTALLLREFRDVAATTLLLAHSHLFVFFPIFGVLALVAFYLPSVVLTDLYWHRLRYGRVRFLTGFAAVLLVSLGVYRSLDAPPRELWEVSPRALLADTGEPAECRAGENGCLRAPLLATLTELRQAARTRIGLAKFARSCAIDNMLEPPEDMDKERFCFPALRLLKGAACCVAQERFTKAMSERQADRSQRSLTGTYDPVFLFLKIFFVLIIVTMGPLLASWRGMIDRHYRALVPAIERGMIVGGLAMLFWPAMDYGYQETSDALYGRVSAGPQLRLSLVIAPWALLLLFYFLRRLGKQGELIGRVAGVVTAGVAVLHYEELNDWAVRLLGIGTEPWIVAVLAMIAVCGLVALWVPWNAARVTTSAAPHPS